MRRISPGVLYMAGSALALSVMSVLVKLASRRGLPTGEIVLVRALVTLVLSFAMVRRARLPPLGSGTPGSLARLLLRGALGFGGLAGYYIAVVHLPLADASTLQNTIPLMTAGIAWWLLGERVSWWTALAIVVGAVGVTVVARPFASGADALDPVGVVGALGGALCSAFAYVTVRKLARTEHALVIVLCFPLVATPLAIPWAAYDWVTPSLADVGLLIAVGIATQIGQVFLTLGLAREKAANASSVNYLQVAFGIGWDFAVFGKVPVVWTIVGAALVVGGTVLTALAASGRAAGSPAPGATRSAPRG